MGAFHFALLTDLLYHHAIISTIKMKRITGAVIGAGYWGPNLVRNFLKVPGVEIKYICDTDIKKFRICRKEFPSVTLERDYTKVLTDPDILFVAIATPLHTHFDLAKKALISGKHVLVEKPMTETSDEATELIQLAKKHKKILLVGHTFVYADAVQRMKKIIENPHFGKLLYYDSTRINLGRLQSDTDVVWDLAVHDFAIMQFLFPKKIISIQAVGSSHLSRKQAEIAHLFLSYVDGMIAHIHVSWLSPVKIRNIFVGGSKQMITYNDIEPSEKLRIYNKSVQIRKEDVPPFAPAYRSGNIIIPHFIQREALLLEVTHFISCILSNTRPLTGGSEGREVIKMLEAAKKSLISQKPILFHE